ncbi:sacsin N-terminal ATP-binding-like domain-containing protein, partial [Nakamurella sp.]|uniref:sacsin N-terminal ATP-binding-like domain-containing protein n=1 Tax=Nakamurella sp. TaxID=1869182 RepID=UPI003B3BDA89
MTGTDPFGTADLRRVVLAAWSASPARFREDANAEDLLAAGGYAGRALVELAANGVDAAAAAGVPARLRVDLVDDELRLANVGAPLDAAGVGALASLRASAKRGVAGTIGFFGVGFTSVVDWTSTPRVVSITGGIRFDEAATRQAVRDAGVPALTEELTRRAGHVPVLRLPWPTDPAEPAPPPGYVTEVRLPLRPAVRAEVGALLADPETALDLFWALPALLELELPGRVVRRRTEDGVVTIEQQGPAGTRSSRFRVVGRSGEVPATVLAARPVEQRGRTGYALSWVLALDADPLGDTPVRPVTVGAPVPTDEPTTLPARLVGTLPVDDTRRRLAAGPLTDWLLDAAADLYLDLLAATEPGERWRLLPVAGFPAGPIDATLRAAVTARAETTAFLRTATGDPVTPRAAVQLPGLDGDGAQVLGQAIPGLLGPVPPAAVAALRPLGLTTLDWSQVGGALAGLDRPPGFWRQVYRAAARAQPAPRPEDLADMPVPLAGGGRAIGARGCLVPTGAATPSPSALRGGADDAISRDGGIGGLEGNEGIGGIDGIDTDLARRLGEVVPELRIVHPDAGHPLLLRLGAVPADAPAVLADPALAARVAALREELEEVDVEDAEVRALGGVVLDLLAAGGDDRAAAPVLADLLLTDAEGSPWPAVELLLPDAPLAALLADDDDRAVVGPEWVRRYDRALLVRAGVRDGVPVVAVADPVPDAIADRLPGVDDWAEEYPLAAAAPFLALADLDLIDDDAWAAALALVAGDPRARECLRPTADGPSYSAWWLGTHARLGGRPPGGWRLPAAAELAGLYDPLPVELDATVARWIGVRADLAGAAADPADLLERVTDPERPVPAALVPRLTAVLVAALDAAGELDLPATVRTVTGAVVEAGTGWVLDRPWWVQVEDPGRLVPGGADPELVGRVLDLPPVSAAGSGPVSVDGSPPDEAEARWRRAAAAVGVDPDAVPLTVAASVRVSRPDRPDGAVRWWCADGRYYADGSAAALGRVAAWAAGRWSLRHLA